MTISATSLPQDYESILVYIDANYNTSQIAKAFGVTWNAVFKKIKKLISLGLVQQLSSSYRGTYYTTTEYADRYFKESGSKKVSTDEKKVRRDGRQETRKGLDPSNARPVRGHDFMIKYPFERLLPKRAPLLIHFDNYKVTYNDAMNNFTQATIFLKKYKRMDFTAQVTESSLRISGFEIRASLTDDIELLEQEVLAQLNDIVRGIEKKLQAQIPQLRLKETNGMLQGEIKSREWAFEKHPIALKADERKEKFQIFDSEDNLRADVDYSRGFPEFETHYYTRSTEDMAPVVQNTADLMFGRIRPREEQAARIQNTRKLEVHTDRLEKLVDVADKLVATSSNTVRQQEYENQFFRTHNALMSEMKGLIIDIREFFKGGGR